MTLLLTTAYAEATDDLQGLMKEESIKAITRGTLNKQITIVPQLNKLNFGLGRHDGITYYYKKSLSKIFFQDHNIEVKVVAIEFENMEISLNLYHPILGNGNLRFVFDHDLISRVTNEDLLRIILNSLGDENNRYVFGDPESKIFHLFSGLHRKDEGKLSPMIIEEARRQGFRECAFCFQKVLYIPDLALEMEIEREWSELLLDYEPLIDGSARQAKMSNLGQRILRNWPLPLLGYDYSFHLIKSSKMNAIAIPTGKIVVSTALYEALENELELEALLLLAIGHVEMRHSLKQYQTHQVASKQSDTMRNLVKAAGSLAGMFPGGSLIGTLGSLPFGTSVGGRKAVSRFDADFDRQADMLAALYFDLYHENREKLRSLIQKMQLVQLTEHLHPEFGDDQKEFYFNDRIKRVENTKFLYFSDQNTFVFKKKNRVPVQLDVLYQGILENENDLVIYINDRSLISDFYNAKEGRTVSILVKDQNGAQAFKLLEKYTTEDLWGAQLTFRASGGKTNHFIRDNKSIILKLITPVKDGDKGVAQFVEELRFVKGKLE